MAVLTLAVIGICQIAFIRENALDLLIILLILTSLPQMRKRLRGFPVLRRPSQNASAISCSGKISVVASLRRDGFVYTPIRKPVSHQCLAQIS